MEGQAAWARSVAINACAGRHRARERVGTVAADEGCLAAVRTQAAAHERLSGRTRTSRATRTASQSGAVGGTNA